MFMLTYASAGCLPEFDPQYFLTARDAWRDVAEDVETIEDDETYLTAHTALHVTNQDEPGSIPGPGLYAWHVEPVEPCPVHVSMVEFFNCEPCQLVYGPDAFTYACPTCHAPAGYVCELPGGGSTSDHPARVALSV